MELGTKIFEDLLVPALILIKTDQVVPFHTRCTIFEIQRASSMFCIKDNSILMETWPQAWWMMMMHMITWIYTLNFTRQCFGIGSM